MAQEQNTQKLEREIQPLQDSDAEQVVRWALERFDNQVALASSFGVEDMVLTDMLLSISPRARIFSIDTGRLPKETYDLMERVRERYGVRIEVFAPQGSQLEKMISENGPNAFYRSIELRRLCCNVRKVEPLGRALQGLSAWICGLRRAQAVTRQELKKLEIDEAHGGILKINPLLEWSDEEVWNYIKERDIPYNALHDQSYPSIGCAPCTRAVQPGEDIRAGRWWWETPEQKECGLHRTHSSKTDTTGGQ